MLSVRKRGRGFHVDLLKGDVRLRGSLGTRNGDAARRVAHKLETAISEGSASALWLELRSMLPLATFVRFADLAGVKEQRLPTWHDLHDAFKTEMDQRIKIGKLQGSTAERYKVTLREFGAFLEERKITLLKDVTRPTVEAFKAWRVDRSKQWRNTTRRS